jgi:excisionase family DNA binding protein
VVRIMNTAATEATEATKVESSGASVASVAGSDALALTVPAELVELIAKRAAELLAERERPAEPELMSVDEAAELLRCRRQRVYDLTSQRRVACLRDGSRLLFRRSELLGYLEGGER